jgi:hypothetical protein
LSQSGDAFFILLLVVLIVFFGAILYGLSQLIVIALSELRPILPNMDNYRAFYAFRSAKDRHLR